MKEITPDLLAAFTHFFIASGLPMKNQYYLRIFRTSTYPSNAWICRMETHDSKASPMLKHRFSSLNLFC